MPVRLRKDLPPVLVCCSQVLQLSSVNMGMEGFNALLDALSANTSVQRLDLSANYIGSFDPHKYYHFQHANRVVRLVDLRCNQLSPEWCWELLRQASSGQTRVVQL